MIPSPPIPLAGARASTERRPDILLLALRGAVPTGLLELILDRIEAAR